MVLAVVLAVVIVSHWGVRLTHPPLQPPGRSSWWQPWYRYRYGCIGQTLGSCGTRESSSFSTNCFCIAFPSGCFGLLLYFRGTHKERTLLNWSDALLEKPLTTLPSGSWRSSSHPEFSNHILVGKPGAYLLDLPY